MSDEEEKYTRLYSEFINYKKRTEKEKEQLKEVAEKNLITSLLPILDDFERAIKNEELTAGTLLIYENLKRTLESYGVTEIEVKKGTKFNTDEHTAISKIPGSSGKVVLEVIQKGYKLRGNIIRYAKVVV